ncbi:MAG TPA: hypothetical protein VNC18_17615 [Gemmatimonadaceae bacterium]|jgi:hypothetical protein|nr:hypothetical protein [Gemmatimonadaceae bacterium]
MRCVWVDAGSDDDPAKLKPLGAFPAFDIREPRLTPVYLAARNVTYGAVGVYAVASWWPNLGPREFATTVSRRLTQVAGPTSPASMPIVCLDIEDKPAEWYLDALRQWRRHRAERVTDVTLEGHKGGIFTAGQLLMLYGLVRYVVPQCYNGAMTQTWDSFAMALDLNEHGLPFPGIRPFYDAAHLPEWWDGYAFTQGRLP